VAARIQVSLVVLLIYLDWASVNPPFYVPFDPNTNNT